MEEKGLGDIVFVVCRLAPFHVRAKIRFKHNRLFTGVRRSPVIQVKGQLHNITNHLLTASVS